IDIDPGSPDYLKLVTDAEHVIEVEAFSRGRFGHITSLAVNADGTRLYAAVPVSEMFAQRSWVAGERDNGIIFVINTDDDNRPDEGAANANNWRKVIGKLNGGLEPWDIQATANADEMIFVSRGDDKNGLHTIKVTDNNPTSFDADVETIETKINDGLIG